MILWLKLAGGLVVLLLAWGAVRWVSNTLDKANRTEVAEARVVEVEREKVALAKTFADAQASDISIAADIRAFRAEEADRADEFRKKLGAQPITREVQHAARPDGTCPPSRERDPVRYRELFNEAVGPAYP